MPVAVADMAPVLEFDAELLGRLSLPHEIGFVDVEETQQIDERWYGRLADPDGADVGRLDHADDAVPVRQCPCQDAGRHPARSTPTNNGDARDALVASHVASVGVRSCMTL